MAAPNRKNLLLKALDPSFALAVVCTIAFYAVMNQPAMHGTLLHRYTTEHLVEYVVISLFIWGLCDIGLKMLWLPREMLALRHDWLPARMGREPAAHAAVLLAHVRQQPKWLLESRLGKRLVQALEYVVETGSAEDYREHLNYLAEQDDEHTYNSFTLVRFVIAITPVLGFLGTVVHFGTALSGISIEEMAAKLPMVVSEMGQAFNTTTAALAASMSMMFSLFLCERVEGRMTRSVDRYVERELLNRFEVKDANIVPFMAVVQSANEEALRMIAATLQSQIDVWTQSLNALFQRFDQRQQQEVQGWGKAIELVQQRHEAYDVQREDRLKQVLTQIDSRQEKLTTHVSGTLEKSVALRHDFNQVITALQNIAGSEERLVELQATLAENLRVLRETQQMDEAMHGLTAAIHLITARHRPGIMPDSAAA